MVTQPGESTGLQGSGDDVQAQQTLRRLDPPALRISSDRGHQQAATTGG